MLFNTTSIYCAFGVVPINKRGYRQVRIR